MPATVYINRSSRARPRAGGKNLARRSTRKIRSPGVVLSRCKRSKTRHETHQRLCQGSTEYDRSQQYSVIALTNGGGTITERYAYDAYGTSTITDASGTARTTSADNNRYTYTGREFDSELDLYHYRARMYDSAAGRFVSRDPIGYRTSAFNQFTYVKNLPTVLIDPFGLYEYQWGSEWSVPEIHRIKSSFLRIETRIESLIRDIKQEKAGLTTCELEILSIELDQLLQTLNSMLSDFRSDRPLELYHFDFGPEKADVPGQETVWDTQIELNDTAQPSTWLDMPTSELDALLFHEMTHIYDTLDSDNNGMLQNAHNIDDMMNGSLSGNSKWTWMKYYAKDKCGPCKLKNAKPGFIDGSVSLDMGDWGSLGALH